MKQLKIKFTLCLNRQTKRNIERFPDRFRFQITKEEYYVILRCQNDTLELQKGKYSKYLPYAFTEQGTYQLSTVLKSEVAAKVSVRIMDAFVEMRHYLYTNQNLLNNTDILKIASTLVEHEKKIDKIEENMATKDDINKIMKKFTNTENIKEYVLLKGQLFEANVAYTNIYKQANQCIYIIDDYVNIDTLNLLKCKKDEVSVMIFSENKGRGKGKLTFTEFNNFNMEYPTLEIKRNHESHDRYIILDYKTDHEKIYHCGASSKDAGKKLCGINEIDKRELLHNTIDKLLLENDFEFE